ncbi:glutathione peroxidase [Microcella sp.]|uniref:glutathione peroxidase n=1 Tax=Microcella sp. TaxID=1913979 RepID=UPI00391B11BD
MTTITSLTSTPLTMLDGRATTFGEFADHVVLVVNVASRCGLAPQYADLEQLQKTYGDRGFTVLGLPSNQFLQELSSEEKIAEYCSTTWGVTFPMTEKVKVNGKKRHPLYEQLVEAKDALGMAGPVTWNFEKFLVLPTGAVHRFRPNVKPDAPEIVALIEANLPR